MAGSANGGRKIQLLSLPLFLTISVDHKPLPVSPLSFVGVLSGRSECEIYLVGYLAATLGEYISSEVRDFLVCKSI